MQITDPWLALDIDATVDIALRDYDREKESNDRKLLAYEVAKMVMGTGDDNEGDRYGESEAEVW